MARYPLSSQEYERVMETVVRSPYATFDDIENGSFSSSMDIFNVSLQPIQTEKAESSANCGMESVFKRELLFIIYLTLYL